MIYTDLTLLEQMRITAFDIEHRKALLGFTAHDAESLAKLRPAIREALPAIVREFYEQQVQVDEIALVIGDADSLRCFQLGQKRYVMQLFDGLYDVDYVNTRLRLGLLLKRIGIDPRLYLAAAHLLKCILLRTIESALTQAGGRAQAQRALDKLFCFDETLVFETYVRSMVNEIELGKDKAMRYARALEQRVAERTAELEKLSRIDPLTGLLNRRILAETMQREIRIAERNAKSLCLIYIDLDRFKEINDRHGHGRGDEVLKAVGEAIRDVSRNVDLCFRLGGDEFCVILGDSSEAEARRVYCDRLRRLLSERLGDLALSIGIAQTGPDDYCTPEELIRRADKAMYEAKRGARQVELVWQN